MFKNYALICGGAALGMPQMQIGRVDHDAPDGVFVLGAWPHLNQPMAAAFTSSSMNGTYCAKLSANI